MKDKTAILIRKWFKSKTGIDLIHDPSLISLVNEIEALRIHDVVGRSEQLVCDCGNKLTDKELYFGQCLQCDKNVEEAN